MDNRFTWFRIGADVPFQPTFKFWFALMWQNWYIQLFILAVVMLIAMCSKWSGLDGWSLYGLILIPIAMMIAIILGGFYMTYQDQKPNK